MAIVAIFLALFTVSHATLTRLDSPSFRVRNLAARQVRERLTWPQAILLEQHPPQLGAEGRLRLRSILDDFFAVPYSLENAPHIDTMTNPECTGCRCWITHGYLSVAYDRLRDWPADVPLPSYASYRLATLLMVADLRHRVHPDRLRETLLQMDAYTRAWEWRHRPAEPLPRGNP